MCLLIPPVDPQSKIDIRFLTLNLCCLASGLRNANLATQTFVGGIISFLLCWICGTSFLWHLLDIFARSTSWTAVATITLLPCMYASTYIHMFNYCLGTAQFILCGLRDPFTCVYAAYCVQSRSTSKHIFLSYISHMHIRV